MCAALAPEHDAIWGLASLSLTPEGRAELSEIVGMELTIPEGLVTRRSLADTLKTLLKREGVDCTVEVAERLMQRGLEIAKGSGASMSPFLSRDDDSPPFLQILMMQQHGTLTRKNLWNGLPLTKALMITTWDHTSLQSKAVPSQADFIGLLVLLEREGRFQIFETEIL